MLSRRGSDRTFLRATSVARPCYPRSPKERNKTTFPSSQQPVHHRKPRTLFPHPPPLSSLTTLCTRFFCSPPPNSTSPVTACLSRVLPTVTFFHNWSTLLNLRASVGSCRMMSSDEKIGSRYNQVLWQLIHSSTRPWAYLRRNSHACSSRPRVCGRGPSGQVSLV